MSEQQVYIPKCAAIIAVQKLIAAIDAMPSEHIPVGPETIIS